MITYSNIDPFTLPRVHIKSKNLLPDHPGVYFVFGGDELLYIGKSNNICRRWQNHETGEKIQKKYPNARIGYFLMDTEELADNLEDFLIYKYKPPFNKRGKGYTSRTRAIKNPIKKQTKKYNIIKKEFIKLFYVFLFTCYLISPIIIATSTINFFWYFYIFLIYLTGLFALWKQIK